MQHPPFEDASLGLQLPDAGAVAEPAHLPISGSTKVCSGPLLCLSSGCERLFLDDVALDQHYREHHSRLQPENTGPSTLDDYQTTLNYQDAFTQHPLLQASPGTISQDQSLYPFYGYNDPAPHVSNTQYVPAQQFNSPVDYPGMTPTHYAPNHHAQIPVTQHIGAGSRIRCPHPGCSTSVSRPSDLPRHMRAHVVGVRGFDCPATGCARTGPHGFVRKDKMMDHYRKVHR